VLKTGIERFIMRAVLFSFLLIFIIASCQKDGKKTNDVIFNFDLHDGLTDEDIPLVKNKLQGNIDRILSDLNVEYSGTFTIHVWDNNENYLEAQENNIGTRYPGSSGYVIGENELALLHVSGMEENAEHELAHCISLHIQSNFGNNPRWLWEAVAIYESGEFHDPRNINYLASGDYPTIAELNGDFNNGDQKIYEVGYLITEFILHEWGKVKLIELIRNLGDVENVLDISVTDFEGKWKTFVDAKYFKSKS
jgi:hypothetical protein